jgi:hypothetical protein
MIKNKTKTPLLEALSEICERYPREEKMLITPDYSIGQQVLQALAKSGTPWMNFRMTAASAIAQDVAEEKLVAGNLKRVTGPGILAIIDDIFNSLSDTGKLKYFERHQTNTGLNHALTSVIMELRTKGISSSDINEKHLTSGNKGHDLKLILSGYEDFLKKNKLIDKAGLTMLALECLKKKRSSADGKYIILSRYYMSGLEREFLERFAGDSLMVIEDGRVFGLKGPRGVWAKEPDPGKITCLTDAERLSWLYAPREAPAPFDDGSIEMFSAIGFRNEIREIFRRIVKDRVSADQVEIVYTDPGVYVREIFSLCEKLNIPVTFSEGVPVYTRSPFRAITGFLAWIKHDFMEIYLRRMLEGEDIRLDAVPAPDIDGPTLAHLLGISGVGWGRDRYSRVLEKKADKSLKKAEKPLNDEEAELKDKYIADANNARALKSLCEGLLQLVPGVDDDGNVDLNALCDGCVKFLKEYTVVSGPQDEGFLLDAISRLTMIGEFGAGKLDIGEAVEKLTGTISAIKVGASAPRPGHIHASYYKHGGRTARSNTFVVGLDESRFPGRGLQDPILLDVERKAISDDMELSTDKTRKNTYDMASMLAGLRGKVTASFSAFNVKDERKVFPSSVLLQLYRLKKGNPDSDYEEMLRYMGKPVSTTSAVSRDLPLDISEWWISRLAEGEVIKNGLGAVIKVYPGIKEGLKAEEARSSPEFTEYDGKVRPVSDELDPRENRKMVLSCSKLEKAAGCPYKYFLSIVLGVDKPEETIKDPASWLDPMQKGSLLHEVFEEFTKELRKHKTELSREKQKAMILGILRRTADKHKEEIPPPNELAFEGEYVQMERDIDIFLSINERLKTCAVYEELSFGIEGKPPVSIPLGNGKTIILRGIVDRIDKAGENEYHVWDYKTGSAYKYEARQYLQGGEMLQHALYAAAVEMILKDKGDGSAPKVTLSGYLLPSEKGCGDGKGSIFPRDPSKKEIWQGALNILLDLISSGSFLIPDKAQCSFCDYSCICGDKKTHDRAKMKKDTQDAGLDLWKELKEYD